VASLDADKLPFESILTMIEKREPGSDGSITRSHRWTLVVFLIPLVIYLCFPTRNFYWDGIYFAQVIEDAKSVDVTLLHPNHLIYNYFGYAIYKGTLFLGIEARAITILQIVNSLLSSLTAVVFFYTLRFIFRSDRSATVLTLLFSFSATWWKYSTDADSYILSVLLLIVGLNLVLPGRRPRPVLVAFVHAISMCFHQLAVFFFPVIVLGIWLQASDAPKTRRLLLITEYAAAAFVLTITSYGVAFFLLTGGIDFGGFAKWTASYAPTAHFTFSVGESLTHTLRGEVKLFFEGRFNFFREILNPLTAFLGAALIAVIGAFFFQVRSVWKKPRSTSQAKNGRLRSILWLCLVWIATYFVFLFFWHPQNTFYRLFYFPALIILFGLFLTWREILERSKWIGPLMVGIVFVSNFLFFILPYSRIRKETPLDLARGLNNHWTDHTVVYFSELESDARLVKYFNPRARWRSISEMGSTEFEKEVSQIYAEGGEAWIETSAFDDLERRDGGAQWLQEHGSLQLRVKDPAYHVVYVKVVP
jgi:hypothetical protein